MQCYSVCDMTEHCYKHPESSAGKLQDRLLAALSGSARQGAWAAVYLVSISERLDVYADRLQGSHDCHEVRYITAWFHENKSSVVVVTQVHTLAQIILHPA